MPVIEMFGGLVPRLSRHMLKADGATVAHDVKLRNGKLQAWQDRLKIAETDETALTIHYYGCCPLAWDSCVTATEYLPDYGRLYLTGRTDKPEQAVMDGCEPSYLYLGVPAPATPPTISGYTEATGEDASARAYLYTYINQFGEEGGPSPAGLIVSILDGAVVNVAVSPPPDGYGVVGARLYRLGTGYLSGADKEQTLTTDYMFVADIQLPTLTYADRVKELALGWACPTRETRVPPEGLRQIRHIKSSGTLAGVTNNQVHFTTDYQPWNWPAAFDVTVPHNIVHMVTLDNWVFVSTDGRPFVIDGSPKCDARQARCYIDTDVPLADIGCGYANSAISTPFGMVYSTTDGLVLITPSTKFEVLTSGWFSTDEWRRLRPETVRLAYWRGYLFCVTDEIAFMLEIDGESYTDYKAGALVTISDRPLDMHVTENGALLLLEDGVIWQWDAAPSLRPYQWVSRELSFGGEANPTSAKVRTDGITVFVYTPWPDCFYSRWVYNEAPFRIGGRLGRHLNYRMGFSGTGTVEFAELGMMHTTVNGGA